MIKPNEHEMRRLVDKPLVTVEDYRRAAAKLVEKGIRVVVVSLGEKGALFVTRGQAFHVLGIKTPVKSKVGAGDSLVGGFVLGLFKRMSLEKAASLGVAASVSSVMREAPRLCRRQDIAGLLKKIRIRRLN